MIKLMKRITLLWLLMCFSIAVKAADWPATLYMVQSSFSATGRISASGTDGVYNFTLTYPVSNTTAPRHWVFSTASTATNAKKGTYKIYGASPISEGTSIQPIDGKSYSLSDISTAEDAESLINGNTICSFLPIYCNSATFMVTVNLNDMSVVFQRDPVEEAVSTLGIFNKSTTSALATSEVNADGKAFYSMNLNQETNVYFAANASTRTETTTKSIWGSHTQINPQNVMVSTGNAYPLERTTYYQVYTAEKCYFTLPAGSYDIIADINTGKVEFAEYTGRYRPKPATLNMRSHTFATSYASATGDNGIYTFTFDKSGSLTSAPFYAVFTEATSLSSAQKATWVLGASTEKNNITPEYGKPYPLVDIDPNVSYSDTTGTFMPLYPMKYNIVADLNNMTVTFNPAEDTDPLSSLFILNDSYKVVSKPIAGTDGKLHYSVRGEAGMRIYFSTATDRIGMTATNARNYSAGGHASPAVKTLEYCNTYTAKATSYRRLYTDKNDFFVLPGKCDIALDTITGIFSIMPYTGDYDIYPDHLEIHSSSLTATVYATAEGNDGVYVFEYTTQSGTSAPRNIVFTDGTSYANITPASWVLGASDDGTNVTAYPGLECRLHDVNATDVRDNGKGYFTPFYAYTYTITVDLKNQTVKWGDPVEPPFNLNLLDNRYGIHAQGYADDNGIYTFNTRTYSSHPLFIADATSSATLRTTPWIFMGSPFNGAEDTNITNGYNGSASRSFYYQINYGGTGFWISPEGCNEVQGRLDIRNNTIEWEVTPFIPRDIEVLYMLDKYMKPIAKAVSDNSGIYDFTVNIESSASIAFSDSDTDQNDPQRAFYGSGVPYSTSRITPESATEYDLYLTASTSIGDDKATFYLTKGKWRVHVDMNSRKISFEDISLGDTWYIPDSLLVCDDDFNVIAKANTTTDGVFTFTNVIIPNEKEITKVILLDPADNGKIFGSNATGELGPTIESGEIYNLYMPTRLWVNTDGASCFGLEPATYNITADFNNKTVIFVNPEIPVYPAKIQLTISGDEPRILATASGSKTGIYKFSLRNENAVTVNLTNPADSILYGSITPNPVIAADSIILIVESTTPNTFTIPEGIWTIELSLADMTMKFNETVRPRFVSTNIPSGETFYSYFGAGTDPELCFTFNNNIKSVSGVYIVLGDYNGGIPTESDRTRLGLRKTSVTENNVIIDCSGQLYEIPDSAASKVYIVLTKVVDVNNEILVTDPIDGLPEGSMVFEYPFEKFKRINIGGKFDLSSGSNIDEVAVITMSVNHFDHISFSNVIFTANDSIVFPARWERGDTDADGYTPLTVKVPMAARGLGELKVLLENLDIDDNYDDHGSDISAIYISHVDPTVTVNVTPAETDIQPSVSKIMITWTHPLIESTGNMAHTAIITDLNTNDTISATYSYPADVRSLLLIPSAPIATTGNYNVKINAGDIVFNDDPESLNKSFGFSFAVDSTLGLDNLIIEENDEVTVIDLAGTIVRCGKGCDTLRGLSGIYIVNGVKCLLINGILNGKQK